MYTPFNVIGLNKRIFGIKKQRLFESNFHIEYYYDLFTLFLSTEPKISLDDDILWFEIIDGKYQTRNFLRNYHAKYKGKNLYLALELEIITSSL